MQKGAIVTFDTFDTLDYVKEVMSETRYRSYPVLDNSNRVAGSISRYQILKGLRNLAIYQNSSIR